MEPLSDRHHDSSSCANIHQPLTQSLPPFRRAAQLSLPTHISHGRQTRRRRHAENYRWKRTRAVHVMAEARPVVCTAGRRKWTSRIAAALIVIRQIVGEGRSWRPTADWRSTGGLKRDRIKSRRFLSKRLKLLKSCSFLKKTEKGQQRCEDWGRTEWRNGGALLEIFLFLLLYTLSNSWS